jgi:hypothetical protein
VKRDLELLQNQMYICVTKALSMNQEITNYKGFEIRTKVNCDGHVSLIYKGDDFKGGTVDDLIGDNKKTSVEKAKEKIDSGRYDI